MTASPGTDALTPNDIMAGRRQRGSRVVRFDDDHYYLDAVLAELFAKEGGTSCIFSWFGFEFCSEHQLPRRSV